MSELKLRDWENADEIGTRFPPSAQLCPQCHQTVLQDTWPPDYGGGVSGGQVSETWGSQKFVCVPCRIAFLVSYKISTRRIEDGTFMGREEVDRQVNVSELVPLVERDGYLLTPHDVWREKVKDETGHYPTEAYA